MTGFQRTIASLGGLAAATAFMIAMIGPDGTHIMLMVAGLALAGVGLRHHLELWPQARIDLVASLGGMVLLLSLIHI